MNNGRFGALKQMLEQRAAILRQIREFMAARDVLEVETPVLDRAGNTDPNIHSLTTELQQPSQTTAQPWYLQTSPEFAMKRLLAAGSGPIYQIAKVFRNEEGGRLHQAEFTMLEWYRPGFDLHALMDELEELLQLLGLPCCDRVTYAEIFKQRTGLNPHQADITTLQHKAAELGLASTSADRSTLLEFIFNRQVTIAVGIDKPLFVYDYPECQAALAKIRPSTPSCAERFELFINCIEIANGYNELTDYNEQVSRFKQDNSKRRNRGLPEVPVDEKLLAALQHGLPDCAGVALGLDRLLMVLSGSERIEDVIALPLPR